MTPEKYLSQALLLEKQIGLLKLQLTSWKELMNGISASGFDQRVCTSRDPEAWFVRAVEKVTDYEAQLSEKLELLVRLQQEIAEALDAMDDPEEQLLLQCRYVQGFTWARIADLISVDECTARRHGKRALQHFQVPADAVSICASGSARHTAAVPPGC